MALPRRREFLSPRFWYTFGPHLPAITVVSGSELNVICPDSDNRMSDGTLLRDDQRQSAADGAFAGNPMAGPIAVEGAESGDTIAVEILDITLDRADGQTGLTPGHGLLPMHALAPPSVDGPAGAGIPSHLYRWSIDAVEGVARLRNPLGDWPITVPLDPFVGCIGVCPRWGQSISTLFAGSFGGNMDVPAVRPGATLYLPVWREGGLLMMGDIHAAQGHGEIIGGAIETSGAIHCRVTLIKDRATTIDLPRVHDGKQLLTIASDGDLRAAVQQAYAQLIDWLASDEFGLNRFDAYNLVSQTGSTILGNLVTTPYTVAASVPLDVLPPR